MYAPPGGNVYKNGYNVNTGSTHFAQILVPTYKCYMYAPPGGNVYKNVYKVNMCYTHRKVANYHVSSVA